MAFQKAIRENVWTKTLLSGPSGSGKTYSALLLASGIAEKCGSRVAFIDTENGRSKYYANEFDFDVSIMEAPYSSDKYVKEIDAAVEAGYKVIIVDSLSHEWIWCNEYVNSMPGNSWANWGKVKTKFHNKFSEKIIQSPIHIVATGRGKDKWVTEDKNGKQAPKKVGEGIVQQDDTEYNYTLTFQLEQDSHIAACTKDNTHLFDGKFNVLTKQDGYRIYEWANSGKAVAPSVKTTDTISTEEDIDEIISKITDSFKLKMESGVDKNIMYDAVSELNNGKKSWMAVKDINLAKAILDKINSFSV